MFNFAATTTSILAFAWTLPAVTAECLADPDLNSVFVPQDADSIPLPDSCCQADVCGLGCPEEVSSPSVGFGIAVGFAIGLSFLIGALTYFIVQGEAENYFVAGKSLPLWIVAMTLGAQSVDSNSLLGNVDLSYRYHFFDGAVIPIGLGLSLILNGIFLAGKINAEENVLTLPDVLAKRYGRVTESLVGLISITSFLMLLAGNLVGMGVITGYVWGIDQTIGIWVSSIIVWTYTVTGGLFSVAYTDVVQGAAGWSGCIICCYWLIANAKHDAPPPSIGFPGYVYPNEDIANLYDGVPCEFVEDAWCYNASKYCTDPSNPGTCELIDNGAYPFGDQRVFSNQMSDPQSLTPFPNALFFNWATIFILGFGNLAALDFQVRCMAAKTPSVATYGCIIGGCFTFFIGIPFSYLGAIARVYYGPDSARAEFDADSCSSILGLPTCGAWVPDDLAFVKLLTHESNAFVGAWCLIGIVAASMSTADGAILAMGTVWSNNIQRQLGKYYPALADSDNLLMAARLSTIPFSLAATIIASQVQKTGYLLIVAFDIMFAAVVAPLFGCFYSPGEPSPRAALLSVITGAVTRVVLEFALPKDGFYILPYDYDEFLDYGPAASAALPTFFDAPAEDLWDPAAEPCEGAQFEDYTGVDSLAAFIASVVVFVLVTLLEKGVGKPLFSFPGLSSYEKNFHEHDDPKDETVKTGDTGEKNEGNDEKASGDSPADAEESSA